jgi:hypothetical protein
VADVRAQLHKRAFGAGLVGDARQMALDARAVLLSGPGLAHHERTRLLASCIQPRFGLFARIVPAEVRETEFANFDSLIRAHYLPALARERGLSGDTP